MNLQNCTVLKQANGYRMVKVQEDRILATFSTGGKTWDFENKHNGKPCVPFEGWTNSATGTFNLYFFQESKLCDKFAALRTRQGKFNIDRVIKLFQEAQCKNLMEQIDHDCEGPVNVQEIIDNWTVEHPLEQNPVPKREVLDNQRRREITEQMDQGVPPVRPNRPNAC